MNTYLRAPLQKILLKKYAAMVEIIRKDGTWNDSYIVKYHGIVSLSGLKS